MEFKHKMVVYSEDCHKDDSTCVKEEHSNPDEMSIESPKQHLQHNKMYIAECVCSSDKETKLGIQQESWEPNVASGFIKSDPEQSSTCLGSGTIKGLNEVYIKEEAWWCDEVTTDSHNKEKDTDSDKHEVSNDMLSLEPTRFPLKAVYLDDCFSNEEKDNASLNPVCVNDASQRSTITQNICSVNSNPTSYSGHLESDKNKDDESTQAYKCDLCEKCFMRKSDLQRHKLVHTGRKPYKCDMCVKSFTRKSIFQKHKMLHSGLKPYKCDACEKCFIYRTDLQRHKLLHSDAKPNKCEICAKCFTWKSELQRHTLFHSGTKPYFCDICEKCFTQKSHLQSHKLLHSGTTPYKCVKCEKCFTQKSDLQRHKMLHSGTKPYKCDICEKCFTQNSNLQSHKLIHSGTKPYKCDICEKCFTKKSSLVKHTLQHSVTKPCK